MHAQMKHIHYSSKSIPTLSGVHSSNCNGARECVSFVHTWMPAIDNWESQLHHRIM